MKRYRITGASRGIGGAIAEKAEAAEHSLALDRGQDRLPELERVLHEQVRARRFFAIGPRRSARARHSSAQYLSRRHEHGNLECSRRRMAARANDVARRDR